MLTARLARMPHDSRTLRQVAELHATSIDQGFLSSLGPQFLIALYRAIDRSSSGTLIVARDSTRVIGFVSGGSGMGPIYREMLRDWPTLTVALAPLLLRPSKVLGILEILRRGGGRQGAGDLPAWELFSIAVVPSARGSEVAERLYQALCAHFRDQGIEAFRIVVGNSLDRARRFYIRVGAVPTATVRLHGDAVSTIYVHRLTEDRTASTHGERS